MCSGVFPGARRRRRQRGVVAAGGAGGDRRRGTARGGALLLLVAATVLQGMYCFALTSKEWNYINVPFGATQVDAKFESSNSGIASQLVCASGVRRRQKTQGAN